jgi:hypothetical protein
MKVYHPTREVAELLKIKPDNLQKAIWNGKVDAPEKSLARLAAKGGGNASVVNNITILYSQIGSVQTGDNNKSNSNVEQHKNTEEKKSVFWKIILSVVGIVGAIVKIIHNLLSK